MRPINLLGRMCDREKSVSPSSKQDHITSSVFSNLHRSHIYTAHSTKLPLQTSLQAETCVYTRPTCIESRAHAIQAVWSHESPIFCTKRCIRSTLRILRMIAFENELLMIVWWLPVPLPLVYEPVVYLLLVEPRWFCQRHLLVLLHICCLCLDSHHARINCISRGKERKYWCIPMDMATCNASPTRRKASAGRPWAACLSSSSWTAAAWGSPSTRRISSGGGALARGHSGLSHESPIFQYLLHCPLGALPRNMLHISHLRARVD